MEPVKIRFVDELQDLQQPGDAVWLSSGGSGVTNAAGEPVPEVPYACLSYLCPHCGDQRAVMVRPHQSEGQSSWAWDGDKELPTLTPSIQHRGGCAWHGYITAGWFRDA